MATLIIVMHQHLANGTQISRIIRGGRCHNPGAQSSFADRGPEVAILKEGMKFL
jgi:hypothetical protein